MWLETSLRARWVLQPPALLGSGSIPREGKCPGYPELDSVIGRGSQTFSQGHQRPLPWGCSVWGGTLCLGHNGEDGLYLAPSTTLGRRGLHQLRDSQIQQVATSFLPSNRNRLEGGNSLPGPRSVSQNLELSCALARAAFLT